jgi:hypothetical protein
MVRTLLIVAAAGIVLMLISFGGAAALGGPDLLRGGWTLNLDDRDRDSDGSAVGWSGPSVERTLEWSGSDTLTVAVPADVTYTQGAEASVVVRGPQEAVDRLTLVDGRLAFSDEEGIGRRIHILGRSDGLSITITAPDVSRFVLEGFGDLELNGIDVETLDILVQGAGDIEARGRADQLNLTVEGAGDADLDELFATNAEIRIEGAGQAEVRATDRANVVIEGVGDVDFAGRPATLTQDVSGVGSVDISED